MFKLGFKVGMRDFCSSKAGTGTWLSPVISYFLPVIVGRVPITISGVMLLLREGVALWDKQEARTLALGALILLL